MSVKIDPQKVDFKRENKWLVQVGVSRAHVHLTQEHVEALFGEGHQLTVLRNLGQIGQYACKETVNVVGSKGVLQQVRIIGPVRSKTQVELSRTDTFTLGVDAPIRDSGDTENTPGAVLIGPKGVVVLEQGCMIARAHIHMMEKDAAALELADGDKVSILIKGKKTVCYHDVKVRMIDGGMTEFHIDTDEANAALIETGDVAMIKHKEIIIKDNFGNIIDVDTDNISFSQCKTPDDPHFLEGIWLLRSVFEYPASVQREITEKLLKPEIIEPNEYYMFVALEKNKVIGIASFFWMPGVNFGYLEHIGITPEYQNRGYGSFFFNKIISFLVKSHPDIEGILLEVRQNKEYLDDRKQFFLNNGAIPVNTTFYHPRLAEVMLMFKPETDGARLTTATMDMALQTLSKIL